MQTISTKLSSKTGGGAVKHLESKVTRTVARVAHPVQCSAQPQQDSRTSRRNTLLGALALVPVASTTGLALPVPEAQATNVLATYWKGRQRANSDKLLAPVIVSRRKLEKAAEVLAGTSENKYAEALTLVRSASCNCYTYDVFSASDTSFDAKASVLTSKLQIADNCTFRLIIKNITGLLPDDAPTKLKAYALLESLINNFSLLDDFLDRAAGGDSEGVERVPGLMTKVLEDNAALNTVISECLETDPFKSE